MQNYFRSIRQIANEKINIHDKFFNKFIDDIIFPYLTAWDDSPNALFRDICLAYNIDILPDAKEIENIKD